MVLKCTHYITRVTFFFAWVSHCYSAINFLEDFILYDVNELNLEYRSGFGFGNFFPLLKSSTFKNLLNTIAKKITKFDTRLPKAVLCH